MVCPKCHLPKIHDDFYWRKGKPTELIYKDCKACVTARVNEKQRTKALNKKDFLYQYFN